MADNTVETNRQTETTNETFSSVVIGILVGFCEEKNPLVVFPGNPTEKAIKARTTSSLTESHVGKEIALLFEAGDLLSPIIIGPIQNTTSLKNPKAKQQWTAEIDGERIQLSAKNEIVFKCGKSSITLTKAGKVIIRGSYLLNRSSGVNRIKGGSVQIN
jgi:hypothetical protein